MLPQLIIYMLYFILVGIILCICHLINASDKSKNMVSGVEMSADITLCFSKSGSEQTSKYRETK